MIRLFVSGKNIHKDTVNISDAGQVHHLKDVLRVKAGRPVVVFDELGSEYAGTVETVSAMGVIVKIAERRNDAESGRQLNLVVAVAIPKKAKFDDIVDKLTQLGVGRIIPMITERTIIKLDGAKASARVRRWQKIAQSAAEQSQRNDLPVIEPVKKIEEVVKNSASYDLKLIPALTQKNKTLKQVLAGGKPKKIIVLIGPEGDFTPGEIEFCAQAGFISVSLGKRVLRVDTAAVAAASYIMLGN